MTTKEIILENTLRNEALYAPYNPYTGVGSLIPRFEFLIDDETTIYLPNSMNGVVGEFQAPGKTMRDITKAQFAVLYGVLTNLRINYDFEFWGITCVFIQDKITKQPVNFRLRLPQRILLKVLIDMFWAKVPIRIILLKARQWGGSTLVQMFMAWLQIFHFENWHSAIVGDVEEQARTIRGMYRRMSLMHPVQIQELTFSSFERSTKNLVLNERGCIISIGSMQRPEGLRSSDIMMAHKSECASWKETMGKKPEDLIQSLSGMPLVHGTVDVEESTAKGIGNYFHKSWLQAVNKESDRIPIFIPWFCIDMYQRPFFSETELKEFAERMDDYSLFLWNEGATLEGINWYYWKRRHEGWDAKEDHWRMMAEYPTTSQEAFQSTGRRAFSPTYVKHSGQFACNPEFVGEIFGDSQTGPECLNHIKFDSTPNGNLHIWEMPDTEKVWKNRYVVPVDIGGRSDGADYSVIRVIDRLPILEGGVPICILTWRGHLDQDIVVWKAAQIAKAYGNGVLVPETNSLDKTESEGDHFLTVLNEIVDYYPHIYCRTSLESIKQGAPVQYGFHTGHNKTALIDNLNKLLRELGYIELDQRAVNEWDSYEIKKDGSYGAVDGQHDDILMPTAIGLYISDKMDMPVEIIRKKQTHNKKIVNESSF